MSEKRFDGVYISPITPFTAEGALDESVLGGLIEFFLDKGADGIYALATAGRGPLMTVEERMLAAEIIMEKCYGRGKVMIHTGAISLKDTVVLTKHACSVGADAIAVLPPLYVHVDRLSIEQHYEKVAENASIPVFVYNNPWAQGTSLTAETLLDLHEKGYVTGVADSSNDMNTLYRLLEHSATFTVLIAGTALTLPGLILGCPGVVTAIGNVIPESYVAMYRAVKAKRYQDAVTIQKEIFKISLPLRLPPLRGLHEGLSMRGIPAGMTRSPLREPTAEESVAIRSVLKDYKPPK